MSESQQTVNYKETLNLPKTSFPMKANLAQRELDQIKKWNEMDLYNKMKVQNQNKTPFILHDGPPYANGHLHLGHAVNKIIKDIIVKYSHLNGKQASFILGWDCHGLPIEIQVMKKVNKKDSTRNEMRKHCRDHAQKFIDIQKSEFERLLVTGDPNYYYATMSFDYEADILESLLQATKEGYVYRGVKPVHWCISCVTALADAEIEYQDKESDSIYVEFPINEKRSVLIWTTTPWTIPSNVALAFSRDIDYVVVKDNSSSKEYIVAKEMVESINKETQKELEIIESISHQDIENLKVRHPFYDRESIIVFADHVVLGSGTGVVHTAPAHGVEDFALVKPYNLPLIMPVDDHGRYTSEVAEWQGVSIKEANTLIIDHMAKKGVLFYHSKIKHSYPHCWRCKNPLIIRTTGQFFIDIKAHGLQDRLIDAVANQISFVKESHRERMLSVVTDRPDWCISRQRIWGVPIPSIECDSCSHIFLSPQVVESVALKARKEGLDFWFDENTSVKELFGFIKECPNCGKDHSHLKKGQDILDVWFDSGVSAYHLDKVLKNQGIDADFIDLYCEGKDQFRAWFQVSLIVGLMNKNQSPYKRILTHASVLDEKGLAMSKSIGNVIAPQNVINIYGADILRLWVVSQDYLQDMKAGDGPFKQISEMYRKIRNTFRFLLSNLYDYTESIHNQISEKDYSNLDKWALSTLADVKKEVLKAYEAQNLMEVSKTIFYFMNLDLSSFYLDILKDQLYTLKADSKERQSSQKVIFTIVEQLAHLLAPILPFSAEEVYDHLPFVSGGLKKESIFLSLYEDLPLKDAVFQESVEFIKLVKEIREDALKAMEMARQSQFISTNLETQVMVAIEDEDLYSILKPKESELAHYFIVSDVLVDYRNRSSFKEFAYVQSQNDRLKGLKIYIYKAAGTKCPRCWKYFKKEENSLCSNCESAVKA